jgi:hypothetical protein
VGIDDLQEQPRLSDSKFINVSYTALIRIETKEGVRFGVELLTIVDYRVRLIPEVKRIPHINVAPRKRVFSRAPRELGFALPNIGQDAV